MHDFQALQQAYDAYRSANEVTYTPRALYAPVNYIMDLGGKRLRPLMLAMGYQLFAPIEEKIWPLAHAVEVFHNFTLVHDDIMDAAPIRRGHPTVHTKWDVNTGILSGDVMLILAYESLLKFADEAKIPGLLRTFNRVAREVCEGQQLDVDFEARDDVQISEYIKMIELKTAVLLAGSLEMGAFAAGASAEDVRRIYEFGRNIGIAFQLQDDILDTFGDPATFGKRIGGDIVQNKKTFLILKAMEVADEDQRYQLDELMSNYPEDEEAKIAEVTELLRSLGMPDLAAQERNRFCDAAYQALEAIQIDEQLKKPLMHTCELIISRDK